MPEGKEYETRKKAQEYATKKDGVVIERERKGKRYFVVIPRPIDLPKFFKENTKNMGGAIVDELGYTHGGMPPGKRGPIKYAAGGAVRGKRFVGTF